MEFCISPTIRITSLTSPRISSSRSQTTNLEEGKLLSMLIHKKHNFYHLAVSKRLHVLVSAKEEAAARKNQMAESLLQRRIAQVKEKECQTAVEDVMYKSILHKFSEAEISMVPKLSECITNTNSLPIWPSKRRELESIHSLDVQEMIRYHVINILQSRWECNTIKIDKLSIGRMYALSILYGYFLKSVCLRHKLDSCINLDEGYSTRALSLYIKGFDTDSLQRCAKLRSEEAINIVEKHTWGLFGDEKIDQVNGDNNIYVTSASMERLALEAIAFGSFLWDVEKSVDSLCRL